MIDSGTSDAFNDSGEDNYSNGGRNAPDGSKDEFGAACKICSP